MASEAWAEATTGLPDRARGRARHLILEEALDGGAEGTAHKALGSSRVVQEADL